MSIQAIRLAALGVVVLLSGCALTTDRIDIAYTAQSAPAAVPGASGVTVSVEVVDDRPDRSRVGSKKNGYGMEMAPILANEDVATTVRRAIETELALRGFTPSLAPALVQVSGDLTRFYNDHKMGFFAGDAVADFNLSVDVRAKDGDIVYRRQIVAQGIEPMTQLATGNNARIALERALQDGMAKLFGDTEFVAALTRAATK
ncbi:MAG: YajG family lipoprotein [Dokdonella sp.]|uniref:YajG family lipoprotein n=1 Tax=Dokdonella sp. TaxID=2291710 RepID=UPI003F8111B6